MHTNKLYFKITNAKEKHNKFQYHDGLNVLVDEFNDDPEASCVPGGFYFTDAKHIFEFLEYGIYLREITLPTNDPDFKIVKDNNKWRANKIILGKKYNLIDVSTFKYLLDQGADIHTDDNSAIKWAIENGHSEIIQYLISKGVDNDYAILYAYLNYYFDTVKLLTGYYVNIRNNNNNIPNNGFTIKLPTRKLPIGHNTNIHNNKLTIKL